MRKNETFKINSTGKLYVGDLCYVLDDSVYHDIWGKANYEDGSYVDPKTNLQFAMVSTAYGDGEYFDNEGFAYPVDAGIIGICDAKLCTKSDPTYCGRTVDFVGEVSISYDDGDISVEYGDEIIYISTGDSYDYNNWDDEDEED